MHTLQYSVRTLLAIVLVVAIGLAALSSESYLWAAAITVVTILVLLTAALGALVRRGADRAYWIGFALFGLAHFGLVSVPALRDHLGVWLWTTYPVQWIQEYQLQRSTTTSAIPPGAILVDRQLWVNGTDWVTLSSFVPTGQSGGSFSAVKTLTVADPRVLQATVRPGEAETIDFTAGRRPGGTDVLATDVLGRQFVFRVVVLRNPDVTQKIWESLMTLLAGVIGGVSGHFLRREPNKEKHANVKES